MDDLKKQQGTSSIPRQALCIISKPSVNSNWSYSRETLISCQNWWFFVPCDLEIWWMTLKNYRESLLCRFKLYASFHSHQWFKTGVTALKPPIWVKIADFFVPCDLETWQTTLKNDRAPLLCCFKLCVQFHSHWWIKTGVTVQRDPIWVKINDFF